MSQPLGFRGRAWWGRIANNRLVVKQPNCQGTLCAMKKVGLIYAVQTEPH
jgi:hypothetical protein